MLKSNSQQKSASDAHILHQQVGAAWRGVAALLRVRTGPKGTERNRRELSLDSNLNCGIAREREN